LPHHLVKTLLREVKVVRVYRQTKWVALFSTDTSLSIRQIIEYYGARWKIEALFKELKRDIGSAETKTRNPQTVKNHLHFRMMAASVAWIYAARMAKTPTRRHTAAILLSRTLEDRSHKRLWKIILVVFSQFRENLLQIRS
jgi:transposase